MCVGGVCVWIGVVCLVGVWVSVGVLCACWGCVCLMWIAIILFRIAFEPNSILPPMSHLDPYVCVWCGLYVCSVCVCQVSAF